MKRKKSTVDKSLKTKEIKPTSTVSKYTNAMFEKDMAAQTLVGSYKLPKKQKK